jgi:glycosyltransferase involved in cell wall biosynthesis
MGARPGYWPAARRLARLARIPDRILAISRFEADALAGLGVPAGRIEILPLGVDLARFAAGRGGAFDGLGWEGARVVLFVGRVADGKGLDVLVRAFPDVLRHVPEARLAVAGPDYGARPGLERLASDLGVAHAVRHLGPFENEDLPDLYASAAAFCLPSRYEAFGIVLAEAMAAGCPVVASGAGAIPEVLGGAGLVAPMDDAASLARALRVVLEDAEAAAALRTAGRRRARDFGWAGIMERLESIYREVTG